MFQKIIKEARPATLVVAFLSTSLGIITAHSEHYIFKNTPWDLWRILLVLIAGLLLQSGVNLINNFFEEDVPDEIRVKRVAVFWGHYRTEDEILIFKTGLFLFFLASLIGIYLGHYSGPQVTIIGIIGIFSGYAYSGKPINYKRYGLGVIMSFIMMGPLMTYVSYYVFSKQFSSRPILYSLTMGLFIPAILLANEIRDYDEDKRRGVRTLTVRIGYKAGKILYFLLLIFSYINMAVLILFRYVSVLSFCVLSTVPLLFRIPLIMKSKKRKLIPYTALIYLIFGLEFLIILAISK